MAQGFLQEFDLKESDTSDLDTKAINTLAGEPIASDLQVFIGNLRNDSALLSYTIDTSTGTVTSVDRLPFANGNYVEHEGNLYQVVDSNVVDTFRLISVANGQPIADATNTNPITRSDTVISDNVTYLRPEKLPTRTRDGVTVAEPEDQDSAWEEEQTLSLEQFIDDIEFGVAYWKYKEANVLTTYQDAHLTREATISGVVTLTNPTEEEVTANSGPGLFISDGYTIKRAFSDNSNPWDPAPGANTVYANTVSTVTGIDTVTTGNLILTNPNMVVANGVSLAVSGDVLDWTHKVEVEIDDTPYYLLTKLV